MKKCLSAFVSLAILLSSLHGLAATPSATPPCRADDLECLHRLLDRKNIEIQSLQRELGLSNELLKSKTEEAAVLKTSNDSLADAVKSVTPALKKSERAWHESPVLWFGVGTGVGITVVVIAAVVLSAVAGGARSQ